jgi:multidrug efflux pump subunit AcrB
MDQLTNEVNSQVPGVDFDLHQLLGDMIGDMVGRPPPVVVNLSAKDPALMFKAADKVANAISKVPGVDPSSVNNGIQPAGDALEIHVDPVAAAAHGVTADDVKTQFYRYLHGDVVTSYLGSIQPVGVRVWAHSPLGKIHADDLKNLPIRAPGGQIFPLSTVATVDFVGGQPELNRDNLAQIIPVTAYTGGGYDLGTVIAGVKKALAKPGVVPNGVYYELGGAYRQEQEAIHGMIRVGLAAVLVEIILLLFLYERLSIPIIIIVSALISTGAVFLGLWITGVELNITAMMGMVMIIGISTEMAIFLFSEYQMLEQTMPPRQAIFEAALNRLRPIVMSTLAMILALLPLGAAISGAGDQMLQPLAIAIIAGITVQLPLVLLAMPVVVGMLAHKRDRVPVMNLLKTAGRRLRPGPAE